MKHDEMTMTEFVRENKVSMTFNQVDSNPFMSDMDYGSKHYSVTIFVNKRQFTTYYSQGSGIKHDPIIEDVLNCLAMDARSFEDARDFEDFANNFGYDTDSRKAEKIYKACEKTSETMQRLFTSDQLDQLYQIEY